MCVCMCVYNVFNTGEILTFIEFMNKKTFMDLNSPNNLKSKKGYNLFCLSTSFNSWVQNLQKILMVQRSEASTEATQYNPHITVLGHTKNSEMDLTFCLLTLPGGSPSEAGPVLIQVKEPDEPFGPTLQFDHLCPGLHYTHASFNCKRSKHIQFSDNARGYWHSETSLSNKTWFTPKDTQDQKTNLLQIL